MMTSRLAGPLVVMPMLLAAQTIVLQAHPWRQLRRFPLGAALVSIVLPVVLELAGVIPSSYTFEAGRWIIEPQVIALSAASTPLLLLLVNLVALVVPCVFIARLRAMLSDVQTRQLVQGWQFRRLGAELVQKAL